MIIKNGILYDAVHEKPYQADIRIQDGKITAIGECIQPGREEPVYDATGRNVYPGLIEAHCHIGVSTDGFDVASSDYNELSEAVGAEMRAIDSFNPQNRCIRQALEGGVTTICTGPGSGRIITGTFAAVKTVGTCVDDMILKYPVAMKCAFGQNVKGGNPTNTRMGVAAKLRETLFAAQDYMRKKEAAGDDVLKRPKFDLKMEALIPVLKGELPLKAHAHRTDDILTAIRIGKEFGLKMTLDHVTEGELIVDELVRAGLPVAVGPSINHATKVELKNKKLTTPGVLQKAGLHVCIISDASVTPVQHLRVYAGLARKHGMDPFAALQAVTIRAAEHIGVSDRVGSLEVGKDADIVIADGDLLSSLTKIVSVFVDGEKVVG